MTAILAEVQVSGIAGTIGQVQDAYMASRISAAQVALDSALLFDVESWPTIEAFVGGGVNAAVIYALRDAITAKIAARDAEGLGVLLLSFYAAGRAHFG